MVTLKKEAPRVMMGSNTLKQGEGVADTVGSVGCQGRWC